MSGLRAVLASVSLALVLATTGTALGCGSDDEPAPEVEPAVPTGPAGPAGQRDEGEPRDSDRLEDEGGVVAPPPENGQAGEQDAPTGEDSPGSDVPPPPGSPEESFERWCDENPQACS